MTTSELENALLNNDYLKKLINKLENWEADYLHANDMQGVDAFVNYDKKEFGTLVEHENFEEVLETLLTKDFGIYINFKDENMSVSSCDDNFITFNGNEIIFHDGKSEKFADDFHAWLLLEEKCLETGVYGGIYKLGYYGDCDEFKFDKNYGETFSDDEKVRLLEVRKILSMYKVMKDLEDHTAYHYDLPEFAEEQLPNKEIMEITSGNGLEIIELAEVSDGGCWVVFEADSSEMDDAETLIQEMRKLNFNHMGINGRYASYHRFSFWIKFKGNAKRFILETIEQDGLIKMMA
jgi:hypothetical protein